MSELSKEIKKKYKEKMRLLIRQKNYFVLMDLIVQL